MRRTTARRFSRVVLGRSPICRPGRRTRTTFGYDSLGRLLTETTTRTDEFGVEQTLITTMVYDDKGRVTSVTDPEGNVTTTEYNGIDKEAATIDPELNRTEYEYDDRGNRVLTRYADLTIETMAYDQEGNLISQTDRLGRTTTMVYDAANRLTETIFPDDTPANDLDNPRTTNEYDRAGRLTASIDERGNRTEYEYDRAGRQVLVRNALLEVTRFEYDARGLRTAMIDALNRRTEYVYDNAGRLTETIYPDDTPGDSTDNLRMQAGYDAIGRKTSETDLAGLTTTFEYDGVGNLTAVIDALNQRTEYGYDEQSNKIRQTDAANRVTRWGYDNAGRVTSRTLPLGERETFSHDNAGNRSAGWTYDAVGNRLTQVETESTGTTTTTYTYDNNDRIGSETAVGAAPSATTYTYDNNGNTATQTENGVLTSYAYDSRNRLIDLNTGQVTYRYDASGIRMSETAAGLTTHYLVDPNRDYAQVIEESFDLNAFAEVRYTYGDDLVAQHRRTSPTTTESRTFHYDGLGSTRFLTDTTGATTDTYAFTAFGELEGSTGITLNDYLYTGEQYDPDLGLYYLRARYYNPAIGRFPTMDTFPGFLHEPLSLHKYLYVHNDPRNSIDPSGMNLVSASVAQSAIANAIVRAAVVYNTIDRVVDTVGFAFAVADGLRALANGDLLAALGETYSEGAITSDRFKKLTSRDGLRRAAQVFSRNADRITRGVLRHKRSELSKMLRRSQGQFVFSLPSFGSSNVRTFPSGIRIPVPKYGSKKTLVLVGGQYGRMFGMGTQLGNREGTRNQLFRMDWHELNEHVPGDSKNHDYWLDDEFHFHVPK